MNQMVQPMCDWQSRIGHVRKGSREARAPMKYRAGDVKLIIRYESRTLFKLADSSCKVDMVELSQGDY